MFFFFNPAGLLDPEPRLAAETTLNLGGLQSTALGIELRLLRRCNFTW